MTNIYENLSRWSEGSGPHSDIVISSRVRLARNFAKYPFPYLLTNEQGREIIEEVGGFLGHSDFKTKYPNMSLIDLSSLSSLEKWVLVEKHLISPLHAQGDGNRAVIVNPEESISIMLNEEDHLRIQCLLPALQIHEAYRIATEIDDVLESKLDFAFTEEYGYLTVCPTNVGTGLRVSVMVHLPGLTITNQAAKILTALSQVGLAVRGTYGEGTESFGNLYQISNQITLGKSEEEILNNLSTVTQHIIEQEKQARDILKNEINMQLLDRVWRAYGILSNARIISSQEAMNLLSELRLGIDLKLIGHLDARVFNELMVLIQPAFLQKQKNQELNHHMRDMARAEVIREKLTRTSY